MPPVDQLFDVPSADGGSRDAVFSPCRRYRYSLTRRWAAGPLAVFVGLNPSRANELQDDPTIRRCTRFARDWGYAGLRMLNLFALVSPDPGALLLADDPVGERNDELLTAGAADAGVVIAAWGSFPAAVDRAAAVLAAGTLGAYRVLGLTNAGAPRHPLYMRADCRPLDPVTLEPASSSQHPSHTTEAFA